MTDDAPGIAVRDGLWKVRFAVDGNRSSAEWVFARPLSASYARLLNTPFHNLAASRGDVIEVADVDRLAPGLIRVSDDGVRRPCGFYKVFLRLVTRAGRRVELFYRDQDEEISGWEHVRRREAIRSHFAAAFPVGNPPTVEHYGRVGLAVVVVPIDCAPETARRILDECPHVVAHSLQWEG